MLRAGRPPAADRTMPRAAGCVLGGVFAGAPFATALAAGGVRGLFAVSLVCARLF
jgi:hypothetical protein